LNNQTGAAPTALASFLLLTEDISDNVGGGKRLFADGTVPAAFKVTESTVTSRGVIILKYERAAAVTTGSV